MKRDQIPIVICRCSRAYDDQIQELPHGTSLMNLSDLSGINCYCDPESEQEILARFAVHELQAIHMIDSGNYHYLTGLWLRSIKENFILIVFDHHTDMQPSAFGGLLSCGGWIADALDNLPGLMKVILIGPPTGDCRQVEGAYRDRLVWLSEETFEKEGLPAFRQMIRREIRRPMHRSGFPDPADDHGCQPVHETVSFLPVYLSIDKDILDGKHAVTGWTQGKWKTEDLLQALRILLEEMRENRIRLLGADICGEMAEHPDSAAVNGLANRRLVETLSEEWP